MQNSANDLVNTVKACYMRPNATKQMRLSRVHLYSIQRQGDMRRRLFPQEHDVYDAELLCHM